MHSTSTSGLASRSEMYSRWTFMIITKNLSLSALPQMLRLRRPSADSLGNTILTPIPISQKQKNASKRLVKRMRFCQTKQNETNTINSLRNTIRISAVEVGKGRVVHTFQWMMWETCSVVHLSVICSLNSLDLNALHERRPLHEGLLRRKFLACSSRYWKHLRAWGNGLRLKRPRPILRLSPA